MLHSDLTRRQAHIKGTNFQYFSRGANGAIFVDAQRSRARKVFLSKSDMSYSEIETVCFNEILAYRLSKANLATRNFTPGFFEIAEYSCVVDCDGLSLEDHFCGELSYEMDFIEGVDEKLNTFEGREEIWRIFREIGVHYLEDASVFMVSGNPMLIDFSTADPEKLIQ